jgi:tetratricopeptide (TPR) repeat protein
MSLKIALTYIVKDNSEYNLFEKSLASFMPYFDGLYVAVTGTSGEHDKIHRLVKKYNGKSISTNPETHPAIYSKDENDKWFFSNFAEARSVSWSIVDKEYDYLSWADTDDLLEGGNEIRNILTNAKAQNIDMVFCTYNYANVFDDKGRVKEVVINHERERFINPKKYKWKSRLHEVLIPNQGVPIKAVQYTYDPKIGQNLVWIHTADMEKSKGALMRNVQILEIQAKEENYTDPRTVFYLAKTYFDVGGDDKLRKADEYIDKYLKVSGWSEEKANAWEYKGLISQKLNKPKEESLRYFLQANAEHPKNHTVNLRIANLYMELGNHDLATHYLDLVEKVLGEHKSKATIGNPLEIKMLFTTLKYLTAMHKKDLDEAVQWARKRHEVNPDGLLDVALAEQNKQLVARGFYNFAIYLMNAKRYDEVLKLLQLAPDEYKDEQFLPQLANSLPPKKWGEKSIVYYASFGARHLETWNAHSLKQGIGGSESAVIYLSKEWVNMGYEVTVFCDTPKMELIDGVLYAPYYLMNWHDEFETLILWRSPHLLDIPMLKAKRLWMDLHDIVDPLGWSNERINKIDKVFFKSSWHRTNLPTLPDSKAVVISNGVVEHE